MATLTIEVPDELEQQMQNQGIPQEELRDAILTFVRLYVSEHDTLSLDQHTLAGGAEFARRMIAENRELFKELARL
jgi:hypothetical protein